MSRWYTPPQRSTMADLDIERIAGLVFSATSDAVIGAEFFTPTDYGRQHGLIRRWFAPMVSGDSEANKEKG